jgi:hypothetical protein
VAPWPSGRELVAGLLHFSGDSLPASVARRALLISNDLCNLLPPRSPSSTRVTSCRTMHRK